MTIYNLNTAIIEGLLSLNANSILVKENLKQTEKLN